MSSFTPGPWERGPSGATIYAAKKQPGPVSNMIIADCRPGRTLAERHANARLITQAPEMFAALEDALPELVATMEAYPQSQALPELVARIEAILAHAKGESL